MTSLGSIKYSDITNFMKYHHVTTQFTTTLVKKFIYCLHRSLMLFPDNLSVTISNNSCNDMLYETGFKILNMMIPLQTGDKF